MHYLTSLYVSIQMRHFYILIIILFLLTGSNACHIVNPDGYVKVLKPKNRNRYYKPGKDRKKKRTKYVYMKKRNYSDVAKSNARKQEDDLPPDEPESGIPISEEASPIESGRTAEQEQDSSFLWYH